MEERFIVTQFGTYGQAAWTGENTSGWRALCDKVLILPDQAISATAGGIIISDQSQETQSLAATTGVLVDCGPQAFAFDSNRLTTWVGPRPKAGDRVAFVKYSGQEYLGRDGQMYRMMEDRAIGAVEAPYEVATEKEAAE